MILTLVGLFVVLAAAWWVTWPMLSPAGGDAFGSIDAGPGLVAERSDNERVRDNALAAIREAEFDHRLGKLSDDDYERLRRDQEERALTALAAIERAGSDAKAGPAEGGLGSANAARAAARSGRGEPRGAAFCTSCGKATGGARFCSACGKGAPGAKA